MENLTPIQREIYTVALDLFYVNGFANSSMRDLADRMNIKASSLYAHLRSKEEILEWMSRDIKVKFMNRFEEIISSEYSQEEKFTMVMENHINCIFENVKLYDVFMTNVYRLKVDFKNQDNCMIKIEEYIGYLEKEIKNFFVSLGITDAEKLVFSTKYTIAVMNNLHRYLAKENFPIGSIHDYLKGIVLYGVLGKN